MRAVRRECLCLSIRLQAAVGLLAAGAEKALISYRTHFRTKRAEQVGVSERLVARQKYEYRYKVLREVVDEIFRTLWAAYKVLTAVDLASLPPFPFQNATVLDAHLSVWENTAYFGELLLRHPDIVHLMIDSHELRTKV